MIRAAHPQQTHTSIGSLPSENPVEPGEPRRSPAEPSKRPPQRPLRTPLRGKFPRRASQRVVPLGWWPSGTLKASIQNEVGTQDFWVTNFLAKNAPKFPGQKLLGLYFVWVFRCAGDHYGANRISGRQISNSGPEMCTHHIVVWNQRKQSTRWIRVVAGDVHYLSGPSQTCWKQKTNLRSLHPRSNKILDSWISKRSPGNSRPRRSFHAKSQEKFTNELL